ncbi:MAG: hypothetical protein ACOYOT_06870 [Bacteroidales bacterium]
MKGKLILILLAIGLLFAACAKEDPVTTTGASKKAPAKKTVTIP